MLGLGCVFFPILCPMMLWYVVIAWYVPVVGCGDAPASVRSAEAFASKWSPHPDRPEPLPGRHRPWRTNHDG